MQVFDQLCTEGLRGNFLRPDEDAFDKACKVWSYSPYGHGTPAVVVQPRDTRDVTLAVKHAAAHGLKAAVKGGGHAAGNACLIDGGMMIDMSLLRSVTVDPTAKTAWADGGCLLGDIDAETFLHGLAVTLGIAPVTGMGLAVNGGVGNLNRFFGACCDNIIGMQLVTSDGVLHDLHDGCEDQHLCWAVRGAGSTLGIATKIKFALHDVSSI